MEIQLIKIENRKIVIQTSEGELRGSLMNQLEIILGPLGFVKADQSNLVNISQISKLEKDVLIFKDSDNTFQIPRRNVSKLKDIFDKIQQDE
ncbi:LytTR family transcriptional regulator [Paenibacillaceae bacterium]|nr:LytTR family transcriptional regulator [Paenibacillaceae bacterium]